MNVLLNENSNAIQFKGIRFKTDFYFEKSEWISMVQSQSDHFMHLEENKELVAFNLNCHHSINSSLAIKMFSLQTENGTNERKMAILRWIE